MPNANRVPAARVRHRFVGTVASNLKVGDRLRVGDGLMKTVTNVQRFPAAVLVSVNGLRYAFHIPVDTGVTIEPAPAAISELQAYRASL